MKLSEDSIITPLKSASGAARSGYWPTRLVGNDERRHGQKEEAIEPKQAAIGMLDFVEK